MDPIISRDLLLDLLRGILKGSSLSEYKVILIIVGSLLLFSLKVLLLSLGLFYWLMRQINFVLKVGNSDICACLELRSISLKLGLLVTIVRLHLVLKRLLLGWRDHVLLSPLLFLRYRIHLLLVHIVIMLLHLLKILEDIRLLLPLACLHTLGIRLLLDCPLVTLCLGRRYHELLKLIF